jgi:hypothetical protein
VAREARNAGADPFVALLEWIIERSGDKGAVKAVVSDETLRKWRAGRYPKVRESSAVEALERWARDQFGASYPPPWAPSGGLVALAGPKHRDLAASADDSVREPSHEDGSVGDIAVVEPSTTGRWDEDTELAVAAAERGASISSSQSYAAGRVVKPKQRRLVAVTGALILALGVGGFFLRQAVGEDPVQSSVLYSRNEAPIALRTCPITSCRTTATLDVGTAVLMICWRDSERISLNYSSERWFNVRVPETGARGWVHSSQVSGQTRVGLC